MSCSYRAQIAHNIYRLLGLCNHGVTAIPFWQICPLFTTKSLQQVLDVAAWLIVSLTMFDGVSLALNQLHWLLVEQRIWYKLCGLHHHHEHCRYCCTVQWMEWSDTPLQPAMLNVAPEPSLASVPLVVPVQWSSHLERPAFTPSLYNRNYDFLKR